MENKPNFNIAELKKKEVIEYDGKQITLYPILNNIRFLKRMKGNQDPCAVIELFEELFGESYDTVEQIVAEREKEGEPTVSGFYDFLGELAKGKSELYLEDSKAGKK